MLFIIQHLVYHMGITSLANLIVSNITNFTKYNIIKTVGMIKLLQC